MYDFPTYYKIGDLKKYKFYSINENNFSIDINKNKVLFESIPKQNYSIIYSEFESTITE